ncbi:MAG: hypothetical protein IPM24_07410 [Bryobacterales bacterium]|nr:hypothetical protein [Bryobacterales bacterium]
MRTLTRRTWLAALAAAASAADFRAEVRQITFGPKHHHFFGYIGHVQNIPWNRTGRYMVALRTAFQDRMPKPGEPADIVLLNTERNYAVEPVEQTQAWNFQQGTMLYWNPHAAETQFFFNDRDPRTNRVFCVLYDIVQRKRLIEFRYQDTPFGNGGVAQGGGHFLGLNYGRMARLRPVTGYSGVFDWTDEEPHPENDGLFRVDVKTRKATLIVSFRQLRDAIRPIEPSVDQTPLFINHSLWNRDGDRIYFYARGNFDDRPRRINVPFVVRPDGSSLTAQRVFIGGHPEWEVGARLIGDHDGRQVLYDTDRQEIAGTLGEPDTFPNPGGDVALSPDARWLVNGHSRGGTVYYTILRRGDGAWIRTPGFDNRGWDAGELRNDPAPAWNRESNAFVFPSFGNDGTRQMFVMKIHG